MSLNFWKKKHLAQELRNRGHVVEAETVENTHHDALDYDNGASNGLKYRSMMDNFTPPREEDDDESLGIVAGIAIGESISGDGTGEAAPEYQGGGGEFGGGGAGGDYSDEPTSEDSSSSEASSDSSSSDSSSGDQ